MEKLVHVVIDNVTLEGTMEIPKGVQGIVLFAHGSGSSRLSPRNTYVARALHAAGLGTLLIDLLTEKEDEIYKTRFNIDLLAKRLMEITHWFKKQPETKNLSIGLFGASTGAAAALSVAARMKSDIAAVVSRGGRPDLVMDILPRVGAPTLFIVGGNDFGVIELNEHAFQALTCKKQFEIIEGATHLFEEAGALENVARLAKDWFRKYLHIQKYRRDGP